MRFPLSCLATVLLITCAWTVSAAEAEDAAKPTEGPFEPTWDSLKQYECPEWFRDAKFAIYAHWGPQSVPMEGDWYARKMYQQGSRSYKYHVEHYGHPSEFGYKDVVQLWKAEKWDPERLMDLFRKAGARYFVCVAAHHDNFDLWNSTHHRWNSVAMGPKRDVVGEWQKAAKKRGLPFGVTEHIGASFWWFQPSHGADKTGPKAGVPYDGADPQYQDLYHKKAPEGDLKWYTTDPEWHQTWLSRITDLIDRYHPDMLCSDGGVPFGEVGRSMVAHFYNDNISRHGGKLEAVYYCKERPDLHGDFVPGTCVQGMERGVMAGINPNPWETGTSISDWFYNRNWTKYDGGMYRKAEWVIRTLVDIVSKNGNLRLNIVQRPDGTLDAEAEQLLADVGRWLDINGDAIYATRPWRVYGEGPVKAAGTHFKEDYDYSAKDIRFTRSKDGTVLYAIALGVPADDVAIRSLAKSDKPIQSVKLLGSNETLTWKQETDSLVIQKPATWPCKHSVVFKITIP